jgi:predicted CXXCH cytochrome family protein
MSTVRSVTSFMRRSWATTMALACVAIVAGCTSDSPDPSQPTLDATFIGYSDPATGQTGCGNCHVEKQKAWASTKHAHAWNDLQASGHATGECSKCHTTNGTSSPAPDSTGFFAADAAGQKFYYDVQCESCHGPGASHMAGPETTQPTASIAVDTGLNRGCGTCHSGEHNPFVEEWRESGHGQFMNGEWKDPCWNCHEASHVIQRLSPDANFSEKGTTNYQQVATCTVCHDPHGSPNSAQLRRPIDVKDINQNLCMQCHNNSAHPSGSNARGNQGHGTQGQVFLGVAGWIPPNFTYDTTLIEASHGSSANPRTCAGCHVNKFTYTSAGVTTFSTGHSFNPTPCVDANGIPTGAPVGGCPVAERSFRACAVSGCHSTQNAARGALVAESTLVQSLVNTLWVDVNHDQKIQAFPADSGLLPKTLALSANNINSNDATITVGDGAEFNVRMFAPNLAGHPDGSRGAHNPFYYEALLIATINTVRSTYALPAPPQERALFAARMQRLGMPR